MWQRKWKGEIVIIARYEFHFISENEILMEDPSNNTSNSVKRPLKLDLGNTQQTTNHLIARPLLWT